MAAFSASGDGPRRRPRATKLDGDNAEPPKASTTVTSPESICEEVDQEESDPDPAPATDLAIFYDDTRSRDDQDAAFERIVVKYKDDLIFFLENDPYRCSYADEVVAIVFLNLFLSREPGKHRWKAETEVHFKNLLYTATKHKFFDLHHKYKRTKNNLTKHADWKGNRKLTVDGPYSIILKKEIRQSVEEALSYIQREVIICLYYLNMTLHETAEKLWPQESEYPRRIISRARRHQQKALARLKEYISSFDNEPLSGFEQVVHDSIPGNDYDHEREDDS